MASCTTTVTIQDSQQGPTAVCQEETIFKSLDENGSVAITAAEVDFGSFANNCTDLTYSLDQTTFDCDDAGPNTLTLTVTDGNGKTSSCTFAMTIQDNSTPVPSCQDITIGLDENGTYTLDPSELDNGSSDNCGISSFTASRTDFDCDDLGTTTTVTLYVRDPVGLEANCTANVTVADNIAPAAYCTDLNFNMTGNGFGIGVYKNSFAASSSDNCGIVSSSFSKSGFDCSNIGENEVIFQVTDAAGNTGECTFTVTLTETGDPNIVCQDISVALDATGSATITPDMVDGGTTDACSSFSLSLDVTAFDCDDVGEQAVTLTATDIYNNQSSCEAKVTVEDNTAPTALCKGASISDQNQLEIGAQNQGASNFGQSFTAGLTGSLSTVRVYMYGVAGSGQTIAPTIEIQEGETITGTTLSSVEAIPLATTGITPEQWLEITFSTPAQITAGNQYTIVLRANRSPNNNPAGIGTRRANNPYSDGSLVLQSSVSSQFDMPFETFIGDNGLTVVLDENTGTASISPADVDGGSSDECGIAWSLIDKSNFTTADIGENEVTLTVVDNADNTSTCSTIVVVESGHTNEAPTANCQDITVSVDETCEASITAEQINDGSSDPNDDLLSFSLDNTGPFPLGDYSVTLSVSDGELSSSCTASVTVEDQIAPIARCIPNNSFTLEVGEQGFSTISVLDIDDGSSDACSSISLQLSGATQGCDVINMDRIVSLVATDAYGNQNICETTVRVVAQAPEVVCQDIETVIEPNGVAEISPEWVKKKVTVPCPGIEVDLSLDQSSFSCDSKGSNTVTLTATDEFGSSSSCQAIVLIIPGLTAECTDITVALDQNGEASITPDQIGNGSFAACSEVNLSLDINSFDCDNLGDNTVTLTVSDEDGSERSCTASVTVEDNTAPIAVCQDLTIDLTDDLDVILSAADLDGGSSDNCGIASISISGGSISVGCNTVPLTVAQVVTVTDESGNSATCTSSITTRDVVPPSMQCKDITVTLDENGLGSYLKSDLDDGSTDNCGFALVSSTLVTVDCEDMGSFEDTYTLTDVAGNNASCTSTVTVSDETDPSLTCPQDMFVNTAPGECGAYVSLPKAAPTDNCGIKNLKSRYRLLDENGDPAGSWSSWANDHNGFFELGSYEIQWRAKDDSNNTGFCSYTLTVIDEEAPTVVCQDISINFNGEATLAIDPTAIFDEVASFDACGTVVFVSQSIIEVSCQDIGQTLMAEVVAADPSGNTSTCSAAVSVTGLPCSFEASDIDCPTGAAATYDSEEESFTLTADDCSGYPYGELSLVATELCGDGEIIANIASLSSNARVGVIMMEDNIPGARFVSKIKDLTPRTRTEYRSSTGGSISFKSKHRSNVEWLKIVRKGTKFKTYTSTNGTYWRLSHTINFPNFEDCIYAGLVLYSKSSDAPATAVIKHVKVMGDAYSSLAVSPDATPAAIENVGETALGKGLQADLKLSVAPNPFAEQTQIEFTLPTASDVTLEIYNLHGQRVQSVENARLDAGNHRYQWDGQSSRGENLPTGIYLLRLRVDKKWITTKVSLINK
ncbi:MAG: HYR domain-containing protein [Saprospiraceae bacterium]|nr:HYR domain-containing protein [Saprospiraceae bacterium]